MPDILPFFSASKECTTMDLLIVGVPANPLVFRNYDGPVKSDYNVGVNISGAKNQTTNPFELKRVQFSGRMGGRAVS